MAFLLRLFLAAACGLLSFSARADIPVVPMWHAQVNSIGPNATGPSSPSIASACTSLPGTLAIRWAVAFGYADASGGSWSWDAGTNQCSASFNSPANGGAQSGLGFNQVQIFPDAAACPANSTGGSGGCQCDAGYSEANGSCTPTDDCSALKGQYAGNWNRDVGDDNGLPQKKGFSYSVCDKYQSVGGGLCVVTTRASTTLCSGTDGGWWRCNGAAYYTGSRASDPSKCSVAGPGGTGDSPDSPLPATPPVPGTNPPQAPPVPANGTAAPAPCAAGMTPGQINGRDVCAPNTPTNNGVTWASSPGTGSTSSTDASGNTTTTNTSGNTVCSGGQCTTTNTTTVTSVNNNGTAILPGNCPPGSTTPDGKPGCTQTTTNTQSQSTFCSATPTSTQCGGNGAQSGGNTGGACHDNPSAAGCGGTPGGTNAGDLYAAKGRTMAQVLGDAKNNLQQSPLGGAVGNFFSVAGGGSTPVSSGSISIFGRPVAINFDMWSTPFASNVLAIVKTVLLVVAGFMAFRIAVDN